jgi:hypothetical protein
MPEIVFTKPRDVLIPGMETFNDSVQVAANVALCQLVHGSAAGIVPNPINQVRPAGVALHKGDAGEWISMGKMGEVSGFDTTNINPFELVYPSAAVAGGWATGAQALAGAPPVGRVTADGLRIVFIII